MTDTNNTHLVFFQPIAVPREVAEELSTQDPLGLRIDLELSLLKRYCPRTPLFSVQEREPFPIIADVKEMSIEERDLFK